MANNIVSILDLYDLLPEVEWERSHCGKFTNLLLVNNRLFSIVSKIGYKSAIGVAVVLTELIHQKTKEIYPNIDTYQFIPKIESLWAGAVDPLYLKTFKYTFSYKDEHGIRTPYYANWLTLGDILKNYMEGSLYIHRYLMNISMLARHLISDKKLFDKWFAETIRKTSETFPCPYDYDELDTDDKEARYDCSDDAPIPREFFFDPEFKYSEDAAKPLLNAFLQSLDYNNNPWLCTPEEMLAKGFKGTPYEV